MSRLSDNLEILGYLEYYIKLYPDLRFSQILLNFDFIKSPNNLEYYLESDELLKRVKQSFEEFNDGTDSN